MDNPLLAPASTGDIKKIRELLKDGEDINGTDANGRTPLMVAAYYGQFEVVEYLAEHEACDINHQDAMGNTALMFAASEDHADIVVLMQYYFADITLRNKHNQNAYFIANKKRGKTENFISPPGVFDKKKYPDFDSKATVLESAIKIGSLRLIDFALRRNIYDAEIIYDIVYNLILNENSKMLRTFVEKPQVREWINYYEPKQSHSSHKYYYKYKTLLMHACEKWYLEGVVILLENGADPAITANSYNAMNIAIKRRNLTVVKMLLDAIDNDVTSYEDFFEKIFETEYFDVLKELLDRGLDPDLIYKSEPLIVWATRYQAETCLKVLLEAGANPNAGHPYTALAEVSYHSNEPMTKGQKEMDYFNACKKEKEFIELLLSYGADVNVKNKKEESIILLNMRHKNVDNLLLLLPHSESFDVPMDTVEAVDLVNSLTTSVFMFDKKQQLVNLLFNLHLISVKVRNVYVSLKDS